MLAPFASVPVPGLVEGTDMLGGTDTFESDFAFLVPLGGSFALLESEVVFFSAFDDGVERLKPIAYRLVILYIATLDNK